MKKSILICLAVVLVIGLIFAGCAQPAPAPKPTPTPTPAPAPKADTTTPFYKDNNVSLVITHGAGGGVDLLGRIVAVFWNKFTGGTMLVKNVTGAGGVLGANQVYTAKPDGLTIGMTMSGSGFVYPVIFKQAGVEFDLSKFIWISQWVNENAVFALSVKAPPSKSMEDVQKINGFKFAIPGVRDPSAVSAAVLIKTFGLKDSRIVSGYAGTAEMSVAAGRGEVDGYAIVESAILDHINKGMLSKPAILSMSTQKRAELFPDVLTIAEAKKLSADEKKELDLITSILNEGRTYYMTPGVAAEKVQFVKDIFNKIAVDADFLKQIKDRYPIFPKPVTAEELTKYMQQVMAFSKDEIAKWEKLIAEYSH